MQWEQKFIEIGLNSSTATTTVFPNAAKSFGEVSGEAIFFDAFFMAGGYLIMFLYTILMLGRASTLQVRAVNESSHSSRIWASTGAFSLLKAFWHFHKESFKTLC